MKSPSTPSWVKVFIGVIALIVAAVVVVLHVTGHMPHLHPGMP